MLPVPIPQVLAGPVTSDEWGATLITRVTGHQTDDVTTAAAARVQSYTDLLKALQAIDPSTLSDLPTRRAWCGGDEWLTVVRHALAPLLDADARQSASERVMQAAIGNFGPHNILWRIAPPI